MQRWQRLHVRVPASTSNLGPGFDFLGLAFGLFLDATGARKAEGSEHAVSYAANSPTWAPEEDLVLRAVAGYERHVGRDLAPLDLRVESEIPVGRGFGSSGAAVAAALLLAAAVDEAEGLTPPPTLELIALAMELEGHPDNGTASLLGGCTAAVPTPDDPDGAMAIVQPEVHASLALAVAWPDSPLYTHEARAALPEQVALAQAIENPRRLALLLEGLRTGDPRLLRLGVEDHLHERYRRALIPGSDAAIESALGAGAFAACLSGAGSGVVALGHAESMPAVAAAMARNLEGGAGRAVEVTRGSPSVIVSI